MVTVETVFTFNHHDYPKTKFIVIEFAKDRLHYKTIGSSNSTNYSSDLKIVEHCGITVI